MSTIFTLLPYPNKSMRKNFDASDWPLEDAADIYSKLYKLG